ncbi:formimidoylglutamase [Corallibacter sp.]|uniref:formimidoylglutamase n=1 Tax=Corallibacter sp. TaxID=2038084 RepID=UPI003AB55C9D
MDKLVLFNNTTKKTLVNKRPGESKFGDNIHLLPAISNIYEQLTNLDVKYVILGIPEDVGVFGNYGKQGTSRAWEATLKVLLNIQSNHTNHADKVLILGYLNFEKELKKLSELRQNSKKDIMKSRKLVSSIDKHVAYTVEQIVLAGKIPIVIGGGHNNAYGNIKGTALALKKPINVINFDAHTDYRSQEGRHSGNGFSYANADGFLKNYFIFGLHENYTSKEIFKTLNNTETIAYNTFEAISVRKELKFKTEMERGLNHISDSSFGIEIDCDAIQYTPSSAMTPSGFSVNKARRFVHFFGNQKKAAYLHICEAAPTPETENQVGKLITYLITDFIKANL